MKIIGGPFSDVRKMENQLNKNMFGKDMVFMGSGRSALYTILSVIISCNESSNVIWLPAYYCNVGWRIAKEIGFEVKYYSVVFENMQYNIDISDVAEKDVVLFMNYYGIKQSNILKEMKILKQKGCILIEDITQSLLSDNKSDFSDYYFGSIRKWMGIYTGAVLYGNNIYECNIKIEECSELVRHCESFFDEYRNYLDSGIGNRKYYGGCFYKCEKIIDAHYKDMGISNRDKNLILKWDIDFVISRRIRNANYLIDNIKNKDVLMVNELVSGDVPFFLPIYLKDRASVCNCLDENDIYCSVLWQRPKNCFEACNLYDCEFGVVCDERYSLDDMERLVELINKIV